VQLPRAGHGRRHRRRNRDRNRGKELRSWAVRDHFYDQDFEVVGWTARKSDHADNLIVSVSTDDAREGAGLGVLCGNNELGSATPEAIAGDPAVAGRLDHRRRRCALRHGTLVGPGVRRPPGPRFVPAPPDLGGRLRPVAPRLRSSGSSKAAGRSIGALGFGNRDLADDCFSNLGSFDGMARQREGTHRQSNQLAIALPLVARRDRVTSHVTTASLSQRSLVCERLRARGVAGAAGSLPAAWRSQRSPRHACPVSSGAGVLRGRRGRVRR
jgi:hypothetical protein